jgi:hypothetical protein
MEPLMKLRHTALARVLISASTALTLVLPAPAVDNLSSSLLPEPTHEIVCSCYCKHEVQTYEWEPNFDCARLNGIECEYDEGSQSTLSDCKKKAQKKVPAETGDLSSSAPLAPPPPAIGRKPILQLPKLDPFEIPTTSEYLSWLSGIGWDLFGESTWPGLWLESTPNQVGGSYNGLSALTLEPFTLHVASIQESELIPGYVDPASGELVDLELTWLTGTLTTPSGSETTGMLATTAIYVADPTQQLRSVLPLGALYPFGALAGSSAPQSGIGLDPAAVALMLQDLTNPESAAQDGDACQECYDEANKEIDRIKRDLKSCLKWAAAGGVVGGLLGALGGPWTAAGGAIAAYGIAAGQCADTALDRYADVIADFCECLAENDCPPHPKCNSQG